MATPTAHSPTGLSRKEIVRIVNRYIGVEGGYLGDFSYRTHADFYPEYCDLEIDPDQQEGTTRERFIAILSSLPSARPGESRSRGNRAVPRRQLASPNWYVVLSV